MSAPRPETNYNEPVGCKECGAIRPPGRYETWCVPCANSGHYYRLMGVAEMRWTADRDEALGYEEKAKRTRQRALALECGNKWLVLWAKGNRKGSFQLTDDNLKHFQDRFHMSLIQKDASGTEHWNILSPKKGAPKFTTRIWNETP